MSAPQSISRRITVSIALIVLGLALLALVSNQFGNTDAIGLFLFGLAGCVFVTGVANLFLRLHYAVLVGVVAAPLLVALLFVLYWVALFATAFQNRDHQDFAANGVSQVQPAWQMENLYDDCRHYITYGQDGPLFNSVAYFGDRYQLTMQVPVEIQCKTSGSIIGEPRFYLNEISAITISPSGQVGASFSRNLDFSSPEWQKVYEASGDFSKIGFNIKPTTVPNFRKYVDASRPSN
ncbi:MAG: hypothetical protein AAGA30_22110 [Planctomycetota bacterium]